MNSPRIIGMKTERHDRSSRSKVTHDTLEIIDSDRVAKSWHSVNITMVLKLMLYLDNLNKHCNLTICHEMSGESHKF